MEPIILVLQGSGKVDGVEIINGIIKEEEKDCRILMKVYVYGILKGGL